MSLLRVKLRKGKEIIRSAATVNSAVAKASTDKARKLYIPPNGGLIPSQEFFWTFSGFREGFLFNTNIVMKKKLIVLVVLVSAFLSLLVLIKPSSFNDISTKKNVVATVDPKARQNTFVYQGKDGIDALRLLKDKARIEESQSGFVVSINERKADQAKKEFWAFYINGKMAEVGAADYLTKDADLIEWKIEKY